MTWEHQSLLENYTRTKEKKIQKWVLRFLIVCLVAYGVIWPIKSYFLFPVYLMDHSMEPGIEKDSRIFFSYGSDKIERGDIIYISSKNKKIEIICRVTGLPGEKIEIKNQVVYINQNEIKTEYNIKLNQRDLPQKVIFRDNILSQKIKRDHYFCLFDNRSLLNDSRSWGTFAREDIIGVAFF